MDKPAYNHLVDLADVHGEQVELIVRNGRPLGSKGREYRELGALQIRKGASTVSMPIKNGNLEEAARALAASRS